MNKLEVTEILARISDLYPAARFSEHAPDTWLEVLGQYPREAVAAAIRTVARRDPTFPPNAYQIAGELAAAFSDEIPVELCWSKIMAILKATHPDHQTSGLRQIAAIDPLAADVVDTSLTWHALAYTPVEQMDQMYRRFRTALTEARADKSRTRTRDEIVAATGAEFAIEATV